MNIKKYKHKRSGTIYYLICITNEHANKDGWEVTAVYYDDDNKHWSRPLSEFLNSCKEV